MHEKPRKISLVPNQGASNRALFERAYRNNNTVRKHRIEIDEARSRMTIRQTPSGRLYTPSPEQMQLLRDTSTEVQQAANATLTNAYETGVDSWNEWFGLASQLQTFSEYTSTETAFIISEAYDMRRSIANGLSGLHVELLSLAMQIRDEIIEADTAPNNSPERTARIAVDRQEISGVIAEQSMLALMNYDQNANHIATVSSVEEDLHEKTDIRYYYTTSRPTQSWKLPLQIKLSPRTMDGRFVDPIKAAPENGATLFYSDYDPAGGYKLARLLVAQLNGANFSDDDLAYVTASKDQLKKDLANIATEIPGEQLLSVEDSAALTHLKTAS